MEDEAVQVSRRTRWLLRGGGAVGLAFAAVKFFADQGERRQAEQIPTIAGYRSDFSAPGGTPPAHWHRCSSHDGMYRRLPGSFESGSR